MITQNGPPPASISSTAAAGAHQRQTDFLPDIPSDTWLIRLYLLNRGHWVGVPLMRWIYFLLFGLAVIWSLFSLPGGWAIGALWLAVAVALGFVTRRAQRRSFTTFAARTVQPPPKQIMPPAKKMPVYVTGVLSVEQKVRTFTALPGFYRSFATREHALLCRARKRQIWGIAAWPEEEIGLWYAFFTPQQIDAVEPGELQIGRDALPGLAITYRPTAPIQSPRRRQPMPATLYLAFISEEDRTAVLADLLMEWQPASVTE